MTNVTASAPGKLILCGEYAVLRGAPAVVMAVDRRAVVRIVPHDSARYLLTTPGFADGAWRFESNGGLGLEWLDDIPVSGFTIVEQVIARTGLGSLPPAHIEIDTRAFIDPASGVKLGLGSSAAATVALAAGILGTDAGIDAIRKLASEAHFAMQGGSGVDIAASCFGGLLAYERSGAAAPDRLAWPDGLDCRVFHSGVPASTGAAIEKSQSDAIPGAAWQMLVTAATAAAAAWRSGEAARALEASRAFRDALRDFDDAGIGSIFAAGHDVLAALGDELGVVYKPSGAGGGDCGIALAADADRLDRFSAAAISRGFVPLDIRRDNRGV